MAAKLHGVLPPMTTPFNSDGEIEVAPIRKQVRFLLDQGAHGAISALLSAVPGTVVQLWNAVEAGNHTLAREIHEKLLVLWNAVFAQNMCSCIKYVQELQGCQSLLPRAPMPSASAEQKAAIRAALKGLNLEIAKAA